MSEMAVKKTDPPASLAKTRQDVNDTPTTATTRSGGLRCLSAQKRSLAVKKTDPPASLAKTRPDTPTTGTTATTRSKKPFPQRGGPRCLSAQKRSQAVPIGAEVISGREKRRSRLLASPRQDLIPQLQQLQELRVAVDCRCLSAQKRSQAVEKDGTTATTRSKKAFHTIYLSSTRWTQMPIGTEAISGRKNRRSRRLVSPREDLIPQLQELQELQQLRVADPPASLAKTRPDTPTTGTTGTTATTRRTTGTTATTRSKKPFIQYTFSKAVESRCLSAQKRSLAVKKDGPAR
ncbi:hypothetical protein Bbelb_373030 [Branchiostoma belcheri]|nr:hypothetical protein Bbelb_373030 [Branchiostoma belcheri]